MKWNPDKLKADTLRPGDPKLHIGTISADRIVAGEFDWDEFDRLMRLFWEGSS